MYIYYRLKLRKEERMSERETDKVKMHRFHVFVRNPGHCFVNSL